MSELIYNKALALKDKNKPLKALALLKKIKNQSHAVLKLKLQLLYNVKNYSLAVITAKELITFVSNKKELAGIYLFQGISFSQLNKKADAIHCLEQSMFIDSSLNNADAAYNLLCLYYQQDLFLKLEKLAPKLLSWEAYHLNTLFVLARCAAKQENKKLLQERAKKIALYGTQLTEEMFGEVATFLISTNLFTESKKLIKKFEDKYGFDATSLNADLLLAEHNYIDLISYLNTEKLKSINTAKLRYTKAMALDKLQRYDEAFIEFEQAVKLKKIEYKIKQTKSNLSALHKVTDKLKQTQNNIKNFDNEYFPSANMVFIFGFPRSGTTLIDNILDTQDNILVLSEKGIMAHVIESFNGLSKKYPQDIPGLTESDLITLRKKYFTVIEDKGYSLTNQDFIVDKEPHHTEALPLIVKMFPQAKLVATIRHPLDVCLSCFQQNFEYNQHNAYLVSLADIAKRYVEIFTLLERYETELNIKVKSIKYENLVTDFDVVMLDLFSFIGLSAQDSYKNFHIHAANKHVTSASRGQTDKALYKTSTYRWKNYERQLLPYVEQLKYFINKYGYQI